MEIRELCDIFNHKARIAAVKKLLTAKRNRVVSVDGLAGSSAAMLFARLPRLEAPYLIIANDLDRNRKEISRQLSSEIVKRYYYDAGECENELKFHKAMDEAVAMFNKPGEYKKILRK